MNEVFNYLNYAFLAIFAIAILIMWIQKKKQEADKRKELVDDSARQKRKPDCKIQSVEDFLDFDKIYNNMIIRKNGGAFSMVINCSGINFDLMSSDEKVMIEEAFIELLNFLRFPIQIYVQTRKVDLKDSIKTYGAKIKTIESELIALKDRFDTIKAKPDGSPEELGILAYEIQRKQNLLEYAADLRANIERMSINKNVLQYKYYIVITYHVEEIGLMNNFTEKEILDMAYTELITRAESIVGALMGCSIESRVLDSNSLAELLYMAFNRDDAELYRLKDNMEAGFYRLFSTTENGALVKQETPVTAELGLEDQLSLLNQKYRLYSYDDSQEEYLLDSGDDKAAV